MSDLAESLLNFYERFSDVFVRPQDTRCYAIVELVNVVLNNKDLFNNNEETLLKLSKEDPELERLHELLGRLVSPDCHLSKIHISFGPDATRKTAIDAVFDIIDGNLLDESISKPLNFGDSRWRD